LFHGYVTPFKILRFTHFKIMARSGKSARSHLHYKVTIKRRKSQAIFAILGLQIIKFFNFTEFFCFLNKNQSAK